MKKAATIIGAVTVGAIALAYLYNKYADKINEKLDEFLEEGDSEWDEEYFTMQAMN